jgi:hypothetical protein
MGQVPLGKRPLHCEEKAKNPETPAYSVPEALYPQGGSLGGSNLDEVLLPKF